jgi:hypothetical protein
MMHIWAWLWLAAQLDASISSRITAAARNGSPEPPYSSGRSVPTAPVEFGEELYGIGFPIIGVAPARGGVASTYFAHGLSQFGIIFAERDDRFVRHNKSSEAVAAHAAEPQAVRETEASRAAGSAGIRVPLRLALVCIRRWPAQREDRSPHHSGACVRSREGFMLRETYEDPFCYRQPVG